MGAASAVSAGAGALGAVTGAIQMFSNMKNKKKVAKEIANMKDVPLNNIADGMTVSTRGADLQKEKAAQLASTQVSSLQDAGSRALIGGLGGVTSANQDMNERIAANLDEQETRISDVRAQDEAVIRGTKEQRKNAKLAALSSQYNAASQGVNQGVGNIISGAGMAGNALSGDRNTDPTSSKSNPTASQTRGSAYRQFGKGAKL